MAMTIDYEYDYITIWSYFILHHCRKHVIEQSPSVAVSLFCAVLKTRRFSSWEALGLQDDVSMASHKSYHWSLVINPIRPFDTSPESLLGFNPRKKPAEEVCTDTSMYRLHPRLKVVHHEKTYLSYLCRSKTSNDVPYPWNMGIPEPLVFCGIDMMCSLFLVEKD